MTSKSQPPALLSTRDAARRLQVAPSTVRTLAASGQLRGAFIGGRAGWRFRSHDIDSYLTKNSNRKTS